MFRERYQQNFSIFFRGDMPPVGFLSQWRQQEFLSAAPWPSMRPAIFNFRTNDDPNIPTSFADGFNAFFEMFCIFGACAVVFYCYAFLPPLAEQTYTFSSLF
jgi:hypothetical protein